MNSAHAHLNILAREIGSVCPPFWILTVEWSVARSCLFCLRHRFQIASFSPAVHTRKQRFQKESFSNRSTLESVFEWLRFRPCIVDDSRIRSKTAPFSFEMGILKWSRLELREYRWNGDLITAVVIAIQAVVSFSPPAKKKTTHNLPLYNEYLVIFLTLEDFFTCKWNVELCLCRDKSGRWSLNDIDDFPQVLLLLLNFKVFNWKCSWNLCRDCQRAAVTVYSIKWIKVVISTCSIEFLVILNYPAITNIFAVNQIILYYGVFAITKTPFSVPWHFVIVGCHCIYMHIGCQQGGT